MLMVLTIWFSLELIWVGPDRGKLVAASARMMVFSHISGVLSSRLMSTMMSMVKGRMLIGYSRWSTADMILSTRVVRVRSMDSMEVRVGMAL